MRTSDMILKCWGTGTIMGIVHVLTGPDHLSALATISSNAETREAFACGVRWGIGHSIGVILVGTFFIVLSYRNGRNQGDDGYYYDEDGEVDVPERLELFLESIVGICMLGLGCYGIVTAVRSQSSKVDYTAEGECAIVAGDTSYRNAGKEWDTRTADDEDHHHHHHHQLLETCIHRICPQQCMHYRPSKKILSVCIGIIHGVAGPGGILGVIPAVQLHDWLLSTVYLGSFAVTSTLVMGIFASFYASCTTRFSGGKADLEFKMNIFSASLSILVGLLWLTLLALGKLHDVFP